MSSSKSDSKAPDGSAPAPADDSKMTALGQAPPRTGLAFRAQQQTTDSGHRPVSMISLVECCRHAIVTNLERYPPDCLGVFDDEEWNLLITQRHQKTKPKQGKGGLDGTGRIAPAVSDKFMTSVEECHEKFRMSQVADELIWKDCVNYSFRKGGLTRPRNLEYPWPILVERVQLAGTSLLSCTNESHSELEPSLRRLEETPMNVNLLMATGIGKTVKKATKKLSKQGLDTRRMESLVNRWKELAQKEGVDVSPNPVSAEDGRKKAAAAAAPPDGTSVTADAKKDWKMAEKAQNWRQLFALLKDRDSKRVEKQGQRMRERRRKLDQSRSKVVKVRPASKMTSKHERILNYSKNAASPSAETKGGAKLAQLKREAIVQSCRVNRGDQGNNTSRHRLAAVTTGEKPPSMFSMAVAGAAGANKPGNRRKRIMTAQSVMSSRPAAAKKPRKGGVAASSLSRFRK